jgi:hypothetical protein
VATLALWSLGIVLMQSAGLTTVTACVALLLGQAEPTVRERLRYWYRARTPARKRARKAARQRDTTVQTCFAPLLHRVIAWWHPEHKHVPLVLDASTLGQRFTIPDHLRGHSGLCHSVGLESCGSDEKRCLEIPLGSLVCHAGLNAASRTANAAGGTGNRRR